MKFIFAIIICLTSVIRIYSSTDLGVIKFQEGDKLSAIELWKSQLLQDRTNDKLCFNIGTAYQELKNYPEAIFWFYKSLQINPYNKNTEHNLRLTQTSAGIEEYQLPGSSPMTFFNKIVYWVHGIYYMVAYAILMFLAIYLRKKLSGKFLSNVCLVLAILFFILAVTGLIQTRFQKDAILMDTCDLHISPDAISESRVKILAGEKVKLIDQIDIWYKVQTSTYDQGWINCDFRKLKD
ncbi:MAG: hypothetical protein HOP11_03730 [Saprospiraceae bacterium]|nr:hypothetical protein [Saprospiraceae bacterium]